MSSKEFKVVFTCRQWCKRWGDICGVSKVEAVVQHLDHETRRIVWAVSVRFVDHGEKKSALLHPSEVAEVFGFNTRHCRVTFDDQARLIVENNPIA